MAENQNKRAEASTPSSASVDDNVHVTTYVEEERPDLPSQNLDMERAAPVIDQRLIEIRNAEAKAQADRLKG